MAVKGISVAYCAVGGIILFSGIKGATLSDTAKGILTGNLSSIQTTQGIKITNSSSGGGSGSPSSGGGTPAKLSGGSAGQLQQYAFSLFSKYGWGPGEQSALIKLWNQESGWNPNAQNPTSTAYGIAQFLDSTWGPYGPKTSNASLQIQYGLEYIHSRYGTPTMAWAHEQANNWY